MALVADEALVDVIELLNQRIDARSVQPKRFHFADYLVLQLSYTCAPARGEIDCLLSWN